MVEKVIRVSVSQTSFEPGAVLKLTLCFDATHLALDTVSNVSVDLHRIARERNQLAFGFGVVPTINAKTLV